MAYPVLGRSDDALDAAETEAFLRRRLGDGLLATTEEYGTFTVDVAPGSWVEAVTLCRDEDLLAYDMFDSLFGVDAGEDGFDVVAILYSTSRGRRILLRGRCEGGREAPTFPSVTHLFPGANWMERETWDMFGIEFTDHPGLAPRILCVENFEGWPLRKDFYLASRAAKPWPGVKEPAETDEDGNVIVKVPGPGEAPGPSVLDELMAGQSKAANPRPEPELDAGAAADQAGQPVEDADVARTEVELDQETYDRLIAEGKSERIARSKAKAAYVKKQRAAGSEAATTDGAHGDQTGTDTQATAEPTADQAQAAAQGEPGPSEADRVAADVDEVAESAAVRAEEARKAQAESRAEKAAEQAAAGEAGQDDGGPVVPEGTPPADEQGNEPGEEEA